MSDWLRYVRRGRGRVARPRASRFVEDLRCRSVSPVTGRRCTREDRHQGDHERRRRSGALRELWPRTAADDEQLTAPSYAEVIGHLDDLIALAKVEGFGRIAGVLLRARAELTVGPARQTRGGRRPRASLER